MNNRGQITIFVIIGLILVVITAMIFITINPPQTIINTEKAPHSYIESCTKKVVQEAIEKIQINGGDIKTGFSVRYNNINRSYLCYTSEYFKQCVNQKPMLIEHIEHEITDYITPEISGCFDSLKEDLDRRYNIEIGEMKVTTKLSPKEILVDIDRKFKMSNGEDSREFENYKIALVHPMYDLAKVATEITNQEAKYCTFNTVGFMTIYPQYDITRFKTGSSDTMYIVKDRKSGEEFNFAIRSCVIPPGF